MTELTGWFFNYRGNGYGPFETSAKARTKWVEKCSKDHIPSCICYAPLFWGTVIIENRKLVDIEAYRSL